MTIKASLDTGGILVSKQLNMGEIAPTVSPKTGPSTKPLSRTGMCMGSSILPKSAAPIRWITCGSSTDKAMNKPPRAVFLLKLIFSPL